MKKYAKRGFPVAVPGYDPHKVRNQLLHFPRVFAFRDMEHKFCGLAKLLALDQGCQAKNPRFVLGSVYDHAQSRAQTKEENRVWQLTGHIKSDYMDLSVIQSDRYPPKYLYETLQRAQAFVKKNHDKQKNQDHSSFQDARLVFLQSKINNNKECEDVDIQEEWKPHFIYALNDISTIMNNQPQASLLSSKIEWVTVDPGSQRIGSFHPTSINFYQGAYSEISSQHLPKIGKRTEQQIWGRAKVDQSSIPPSKKRSALGTEFQEFPPEISNRIEAEYRKFIAYGEPVEFNLSKTERIDFELFRQVNSATHEQYPNMSLLLSREESRDSHYFDSDEEKITSPLSQYSYY